MIILLNGPAYSGKDTAAKFIMKYLGSKCTHIKLSCPLKKGVHSIYELNGEEVLYAEAHKDRDSEMFYGISYREAQIQLFKHLERLHGPEILAKIVYQYMRKFAYKVNKHLVMSDCGRKVEAEYIRHRYPGQVGVILLKRPGYSFEIDVREYVYDENNNWKGEWIDNKYDLELFEEQIKVVLRKWKLINV